MLRNQDIDSIFNQELMGSNAIIRQGSSGQPPPSLLKVQQLMGRDSSPRQGFAKSGSCAPAALQAKCLLWAPIFLLSLRYD